MTVLDIIQPDNSILRKKAIRVASFDKKLHKLVENMTETLIEAQGVGLAAPQVAVTQRLILVRLPDDDDSKEEYGDEAGKLYVVANPKIIKASKEMVPGIEACLSIPGYYGEVDRHESVVVTGQDQKGKDIRIKAKGWQARVFQHEIDHLDGRLYTDIANEVFTAKELEEMQKAAEDAAS